MVSFRFRVLAYLFVVVAAGCVDDGGSLVGARAGADSDGGHLVSQPDADAVFSQRDMLVPGLEPGHEETSSPLEDASPAADDLGASPLPDIETAMDTDSAPDTEPDADAEPDSASPFSEYDDFDEGDIIWLHTDVSGWDVTSTVTSAHINYDVLCVYHTKAGLWPEVFGIFPEAPQDPMEGNIWIIARVDGLWYAATFDYLRPGDQCKYDGYSPEDEGPGPSTFGAIPLSTWVPQSGEPVYMFMSTVARHEPLGPLNERSDYVKLIWP